MDVFELAVLTFMFCRAKNEKEFKSAFGPDADEINELEKDIDEEKLGKS